MTRAADPSFPRLHPGRPARGWVNDPNGLLHHDGRWHAFFQHNPDAPVHGSIVWGHVSSADLVAWHEEPVAIRPRAGAPDSNGCWSGCAVVEDGIATLVYSGVTDHSGASTVLLARATDPDMVTWQQDPTPVVGMPTTDEAPDVEHVRDPFLLELDGHRYAVQGAGAPHGRPSVLVYDAEDLTSWQLLGTLLDDTDPAAADGPAAHVWECPNLVRLPDQGRGEDDGWLLVVSVWRRSDVPGAGDDLVGVRWLVGTLALLDGVPRFSPRTHGRLDTGPCFYAPQLLADDGRVLALGWAWEGDRSPEEVEAQGWAGSLTFPRELHLVADRVVSVPAPELTALRRRELGEDDPLPAAYDAELGAGPGALWLDHPDGEPELVVRWDAPADPVTPPRLLVDGSVVELFAGEPESCTTRGYPREGSRWRLEATRLRTWELDLPGSGVS